MSSLLSSRSFIINNQLQIDLAEREKVLENQINSLSHQEKISVFDNLTNQPILFTQAYKDGWFALSLPKGRDYLIDFYDNGDGSTGNYGKEVGINKYYSTEEIKIRVEDEIKFEVRKFLNLLKNNKL